MAEIVSPLHSFVDFNPPPNAKECCYGVEIVPLPLVEENDLVFQFAITCQTPLQAEDIMNSNINDVALIIENDLGVDVVNYATQNLFFLRYRTGVTEITYVWKNNLVGIKTLVKCDKCFVLKIKAIVSINGTNENLEKKSNIFKLKCDGCYTAILQYKNEKDYADFSYCNVGNFFNRARLSMDVNRPKHIETKGIYRQSDGAIKQTSSVIIKEYLTQTDHYGADIHDKINVALGHDDVTVFSEFYTGKISKVGDYNIEWDNDINLCRATANFRLTATPFAIKNNQCMGCSPVSLPVYCAKLKTVYKSAIDNNNGTFDVNITSADYVIGPVSGFVQNQVVHYRELGTTGTFVSAGSLVFDSSGALTGLPNPFVIPNLPSTWVGVELRFTAGCDGSLFYTTEYSPANGNCVAPVIIGSQTLPSGVTGQPYSFQLQLAGTAPFSIPSGSYPTWWVLTPNANGVLISGTPNAIATNQTVNFAIANCSTIQANFIGQLNITQGATLGNITMDCSGSPTSQAIPFGVSGTYSFFNMPITVHTPGVVIITAHNDQASVLNTYSMYNQHPINVISGQTSIDFMVDYDGLGTQQIFEMFFIVADASGTQECGGNFYSFI
jgi:hypothetical protein